MEDRIEVSLNDIDNVLEYRKYEKQRRENEEVRILNENTRQNNEIDRNNYYNSIKEMVDNGDFNGNTAYEIALKNGFIGTEDEWLMSLKGEEGTGMIGFEIRDGYLFAVSESIENINKFKIKNGHMMVTISS